MASIGKRYARALLELGQEQSQLQKIGADLRAMGAAWAESPELRTLFENPAVSVESRTKVLEALSARLDVSPLVKSTLLLLSNRLRMRFLPDVAESFQRLSEAAANQIRVEVTTATSMPETYYTQIQLELERTTGQKVLLTRNEDPSIIGGVITRMGDRLLDGSLKTRLSELEDQLLER
jgi:F-type H+-transporting ATPase subunit delta